MDRCFILARVPKWALGEQVITIIWTMRHGRKGIPKESNTRWKRRNINIVCLFRRWFNNACVLCRQENKRGKNMVLPTRMHDDVQLKKGERCKPDSLVLYDDIKGRVDVVDLVSTNSTTRIKHKMD